MFKPLFTVTGLFAVVLGVLLLASPETYLSLYALDYTPAMNFPAQRFAPVILGVSSVSATTGVTGSFDVLQAAIVMAPASAKPTRVILRYDLWILWLIVCSFVSWI